MSALARTAVAPLTRQRRGDHGLSMVPTLTSRPGLDAILQRWAVSLRAENATDNTVELSLLAVRGCSRHAARHPLDLTVDDLRAWLAGYGNQNTRATYFCRLRVFFRWAQAGELRLDDPTARMKPPRVPRGAPRPCTTAALRAMLAAATPTQRALLVLASCQGLRAGEIATVRGEDFDLDASTMRVCGKGGVEAVLPLHPRVIVLIAAMPAVGWWFPAPRRTAGHRPSEWVSGQVRTVCIAVGARPTGSHPLRHWFASALVREGADLVTVQQLLRHSSLATTQRYVQCDDTTRRAAVLRLPDLGGGS